MLIAQDRYSPLGGGTQAQSLLPLCSQFPSSSAIDFSHCFPPFVKTCPIEVRICSSLALREVGAVRMEFYHFGSNSGETTWQKAALEVSMVGILFLHPAPPPRPTVLYSFK